jgi:hypothetical protein
MTLMVASEFSRHLGGRYIVDGPASGEEFRDRYLIPKLDQALNLDAPLVINFDGVAGMPTSFLEEAFGGLVRKKMHDSIKIRRLLKIEAPKSQRLWPFVNMADQFIERAIRRL